MADTYVSVGELVDKIGSGELRLPAMQRRYVWPATRVRDLLDSLYRRYPSGTILVWETDREAPTREFAVSQGSERAHRLLLDGQQRLTSLSAILRGAPVSVRGKKRPIEILFNLDHPDGPPVELVEVEGDELPLREEDEPDEETDEEDETDEIQERFRRRAFVVAGSRALEADWRWVKVSEIFKLSDLQILKPIMKQAGLGIEDPAVERYQQRLQQVRQIKDHKFVMHVLPKDLSYEEVAEIFVRVNSLGAKLRGSDLALAQITSRWPESLKLFEEFQEECERTWFTLDLGLIVRALVVFATGQSRFKTVASTPVEKFKEAWGPCKRGVLYAINFLRTNVGVEDESLLSSPMLLITLAFFGANRGYELTPAEERGIRRWLHIANARGHYSASSESMLDADLAVIRKKAGADELLELLKRKFGRLEILPEDLEGKSWRSAFFSLAFLALKARGAKDWKTRLGLSLTHQGRYHYIEFHHVFAKALLKGKHERKQINELANMAFLAGGTNRKLGSKPAAEYLATILAEQGVSALTAHCIPTNPELWKLENYPLFLQERRRLLAEAINAFVHADDQAQPAPSVETLIERGEDARLEFKSTFQWDVHQNKANPERRNDVLKAVAGFLNGEGGTVLVGVQDDGSIFGLERDLSTLGKRADRDGFQQLLVNQLTERLDKDVCSYLSVSFHPIAGKEICRIEASKSPKPIYFDGEKGKRFYLRAGNTTREFDMKEAHDFIAVHWPKRATA